jgi:hypothetical protein
MIQYQIVLIVTFLLLEVSKIPFIVFHADKDTMYQLNTNALPVHPTASIVSMQHVLNAPKNSRSIQQQETVPHVQ